jgi:hypothetical protein
MTPHMGEYLFITNFQGLNKGLIFKDANIYTQYSKVCTQLNKFYEHYFQNESKDLSGDLRMMF